MHIKHLFAAFLLAALPLASCSDYTGINEEQNKIPGEPTYASFSFTVGNGATRAKDLNSDDVEVAVNSVGIYIFSEDVLESFSTPSLERTVTDAIETTTGEKTIYLVAPADIAFENNFTPNVGTTTLAAFEKALTSASSGVIARQNTFQMAGGKHLVISKCTKEDAAQNPIVVKLFRAAAKVQLGVSEDKEIRGSLNASFDNFSFGIGQPVKNMYLLAADDNYTDPGTVADGKYSNFEALPTNYSDFYSDAVSAFSKDYSLSRYCGENFQRSEPVAGTTTFVLIRCKTTPVNIFNNSALTDGTFHVIALHNPVSASWVFLHDDNHQQLYFATEQEATQYITDHDLNGGIDPGMPQWAVYEYENGLCYYRVNIVSDSDESHASNLRYCVKRNNFYQIMVTRIDALGAPTPGGVVPEDPDQPVEPSAWLACTIDIEPWTIFSMNDQVLQ